MAEEKKEVNSEEELKEVDATDAPKEDIKEETKKEKKNKYKETIAKLEEDLKQQHNEYLKVFAEMENTKKRLKEETIRDRKYASQSLVGELINQIDMLKTIVEMPAPSPEIQNYVIGFKMITDQLINILESDGLAKILASAGDVFDPKVMQAMSTEYDESKPENIVLRVMQNGYMYKDRVLRPAMVVVNKKPIEVKEEKEVEENVK